MTIALTRHYKCPVPPEGGGGADEWICTTCLVLTKHAHISMCFIGVELRARFERASLAYEASALPTELSQRSTERESNSRINRVAAGRLTVLAIRANFGAACATRTRFSCLADTGTAHIPRPHGAGSGSCTRITDLEGQGPAVGRCPLKMAGDERLALSLTVLETVVLAAERIPCGGPDRLCSGDLGSDSAARTLDSSTRPRNFRLSKIWLAPGESNADV